MPGTALRRRMYGENPLLTPYGSEQVGSAFFFNLPNRENNNDVGGEVRHAGHRLGSWAPLRISRVQSVGASPSMEIGGGEEEK